MAQGDFTINKEQLAALDALIQQRKEQESQPLVQPAKNPLVEGAAAAARKRGGELFEQASQQGGAFGASQAVTQMIDQAQQGQQGQQAPQGKQAQAKKANPNPPGRQGFGGAAVDVLGSVLDSLERSRLPKGTDTTLDRIMERQQTQLEAQRSALLLQQLTGGAPLPPGGQQPGAGGQQPSGGGLAGGVGPTQTGAQRGVGEFGFVSANLDPATGGLDLKFAETPFGKSQRELRTAAQKKLIDRRVKVQENFRRSMGMFEGLMGQFKAKILAQGGEGGRIAGTLGAVKAFLKIEGTSAIEAFEGQRKENAITLNGILTGQNRVIKGVVKMIEATLPNRFDTVEFAQRKLAQSVQNAFRLLIATNRGLLTEDILNAFDNETNGQARLEGFLDRIVLSPEDKELQDNLVRAILNTQSITLPEGIEQFPGESFQEGGSARQRFSVNEQGQFVDREGKVVPQRGGQAPANQPPAQQTISNTPGHLMIDSTTGVQAWQFPDGSFGLVPEGIERGLQ